ncbi:MAG: rod-binding protein, partial [Beijerinckiaceae bacterium]
MSISNSAPMREAYAAYSAAAKARPGTREAKAYKTAQNFEAMFFQNMLQNMTSGLSEDGPLGTGQAGGG